MRQALIALFHESSFGLLIKPPEEDYSRIGQTSSSRTGRTSGLPSCSVSIRSCVGERRNRFRIVGRTAAGNHEQATDNQGKPGRYWTVTHVLSPPLAIRRINDRPAASERLRTFITPDVAEAGQFLDYCLGFRRS